MAYQTGVLDALRDFGIRFTEEPGCRTRGSINFAPRGVMIHHTGVNSDITAMLRDGRPGLTGPLCNIELRRHGHVHVIALGRANHAGAGSFRGLSGNSVFWGIEPSSDGKTWTDAQRHMYPLLTAALCRYSNIDPSMVPGHKEYAGYRGKWDPGAWDMNWHRSQTGLFLRGGGVAPPPPGPLGSRLLRQGDRGPDVAEWQKVLGISADGDFGPQTHQATVAFQQRHGLIADGIVGAATLAAARPTTSPEEDEMNVAMHSVPPVGTRSVPTTEHENGLELNRLTLSIDSPAQCENGWQTWLSITPAGPPGHGSARGYSVAIENAGVATTDKDVRGVGARRDSYRLPKGTTDIAVENLGKRPLGVTVATTREPPK